MSRKILTGIDLNNQRATNVASPAADTDAVNKAYVDGLIQGLAWKQPVRAATTANITLTGTQTIDGVSVVAGDRILVKNQSTTSANGIYVAASGAWARATDADSAAELVNATVYVSEGTVNADKAFTQTANSPITLGTTNLVFAQVGGSVTTYTNGAGLSLAGSVFSIDTAVVVRKYAANIGNGSLTVIPVTHNLGTNDVTYSLQVVATGEHVETDAVTTDANTLTFTFATAPTAGQYRVVIHA